MCQRRQKSEMFSALNGELKFCGKRKPSSHASPTAMSRVAGEVEVELERVADRRGPAGHEAEVGVVSSRAALT